MTIHWRKLKTDQRVEAIRSVYVPDISSRKIANALGITKGAVCGMYFRHPDKLADCPLPDHGRRTISREGSPKPRPEKSAPRIPAPAVVPDIMFTAGRPLMAMESGQCRWPVNDAEPGEMHLFCGLPTEATYCGHHTSRAYRERP